MQQLSSGQPKEEVAAEAVATFLEVAAHDGLDTTHDPYTLSQDWAAILRTVTESLSRITLLTVKPGPTVILGPDLHWKCSAFADESGLLHRWVSVDKLDADALSRELHGWFVWGDCCAAGVGMTLHVVEIGRSRGGHQHTAWARCFAHPVMSMHFRFQQVTGKKLEGSWRATWFQNSDRNDPKTWVDLMESDNVKLIHHLDVKQPSVVHCEEFKMNAQQVAHQMSLVPSDPFQIVMRRTACDLPWPCDFQPACYSHGKPDLEVIGGFRRV